MHKRARKGGGMSAATRNLVGMTYERILIAPFLTAFVAGYRAATPAAKKGQVDFLDRHLRRFLEETTIDVGCPECQSLVDAERVLNPEGVFARTMNLEDLVFSLSSFVHKPWRREEPLLQKAQWRFVEALLIAIQQTPMPECEGLEQHYMHLWAHLNWELRRVQSVEPVT